MTVIETRYGALVDGDRFAFDRRVRGGAADTVRTEAVVARTRWCVEHDEMIEIHWDYPTGCLGGVLFMRFDEPVTIVRPT